MIEVWAINMGGGALRDGSQFFDGGFAAAALKTLVAFAQGFGDSASHGFPCLPCDHLRKPVGFRVLNIKAPSLSFLLYHFLPFFTVAQFLAHGKDLNS